MATHNILTIGTKLLFRREGKGFRFKPTPEVTAAGLADSEEFVETSGHSFVRGVKTYFDRLI